MYRNFEDDMPEEAMADRMPMHERVGQMGKEIAELHDVVQALRNTVDRLQKTIARELDV